MEQLDYLQGAVRKTHSNILRLVAYSQLSRQVINLFSSKFYTSQLLPTPASIILVVMVSGGCVGVIFALTLLGKTMLIDM
jgi:hypothetical protein